MPCSGHSVTLRQPLSFKSRGLNALYLYPKSSCVLPVILPLSKRGEAPEPQNGADNRGQLWRGTSFWRNSYLTRGLVEGPGRALQTLGAPCTP